METVKKPFFHQNECQDKNEEKLLQDQILHEFSREVQLQTSGQKNFILGRETEPQHVSSIAMWDPLTCLFCIVFSFEVNNFSFFFFFQ